MCQHIKSYNATQYYYAYNKNTAVYEQFKNLQFVQI